MGLVLVLAAGILFLFALTVCVGPPYVPTPRGKIAVALDLLRFPEGATVVDLGSGDGTFLLAAVHRGLVAYGYEMNPLLWGLSKLRCRRFGGQVNIVLCDFWSTPLPPEAKAVFLQYRVDSRSPPARGCCCIGSTPKPGFTKYSAVWNKLL